MKRKLLNKVNELGATLQEEQFDFLLDTPKGKVWISTGTHCIVEPHANHGGGSWKPLAYKELLNHISYGLENCDEPDCEVCNEENQEVC